MKKVSFQRIEATLAFTFGSKVLVSDSQLRESLGQKLDEGRGRNHRVSDVRLLLARDAGEARI